MQVSNESPCRTVDIKKIHRICADAGELRPLALARIPALRSRDDLPNRAATNTACSKRKRLVEAII